MFRLGRGEPVRAVPDRRDDGLTRRCTIGDQKGQRLDLASQAALAAKDLIAALNRLNDLTERRAYLGNFSDSDFAGSMLAYLDAGTIGTLFDFVVPSLEAAYQDAANGGRNKQILQQVTGNI